MTVISTESPLSESVVAEPVISERPMEFCESEDSILYQAMLGLKESCPEIRLDDVAISHRDQTIVLVGEVGSFYQKQLAQECVRQCCPGNRIVNDLEVR